MSNILTINDRVYLDRLTSEFDRIKEVDSYHYDNGYGIIYVGGGKYWPGIVVGIKMLRYVGCNLPVEVWYRGSVEPIDIFDIDDSNVRLIDIDSMRQSSNQVATGPGGGWQAKLFALMNTRFEKVLYLDADAYVVNDPCLLFKYLDDVPFAYWRDLQNQDRSVNWNKVWPNGDCGVISVQGGQLLIDRKNAWKLIHVANYICENSEYYFKHIYGDQDSWRVGLAMGCCKYQIIGQAEWSNVAFVCRHTSTNYIIHRCQGKLYHPNDIPKGRHKFSNPQYYLPEEQQVFEYFVECINRKMTKCKEVFTNIYSKNLWGISSGAGSELRESQTFIDMANSLIRSKGFTTVIDVGCGNAIIGSRLKCMKYIGYDCASIINDNAKRYKNSLSISFFDLDFFTESDIIQYGDILVCKDVLHHWPNWMVIDWLERLIRSKKWKMILLCQDTVQRQSDCWLGGYRALDYEKYPLNLFPLKLYNKYHHKAILVYES